MARLLLAPAPTRPEFQLSFSCFYTLLKQEEERAPASQVQDDLTPSWLLIKGACVLPWSPSHFAGWLANLRMLEYTRSC